MHLPVCTKYALELRGLIGEPWHAVLVARVAPGWQFFRPLHASGMFFQLSSRRAFLRVFSMLDVQAQLEARLVFPTKIVSNTDTAI